MLLDKIMETKKKIEDLQNGVIHAEWVARPDCPVCKGNGLYFLSVEQWYREVKVEVEKRGEKMGPMTVLTEYYPRGVEVRCDCASNEIYVAVKSNTVMLERLQRNYKWIQLALGNEYLKKDFSNLNWPIDKNKEICRDWIRPSQERGGVMKNLYIHGIPGKGKTHLLSAIAQYFSDRDIAILKYNEIMEIASDYIREGRSAFIDGLCFAGVLFIDDFGNGGNLTKERHNVLMTILDYRMANNKPFVFTSEKAPRDLFPDATMDVSNLKWRIEKDTVILNLN